MGKASSLNRIILACLGIGALVVGTNHHETINLNLGSVLPQLAVQTPSYPEFHMSSPLLHVMAIYGVDPSEAVKPFGKIKLMSALTSPLGASNISESNYVFGDDSGYKKLFSTRTSSLAAADEESSSSDERQLDDESVLEIRDVFPEALSEQQANSYSTLVHDAHLLRLNFDCFSSGTCGMKFGRTFSLRSYEGGEWIQQLGLLASETYGFAHTYGGHGGSGSSSIYSRHSRGRAGFDDSQIIRNMNYYSHSGQPGMTNYYHKDKPNSVYNSGSRSAGHRTNSRILLASEPGHPIVKLLELSVLFGVVVLKEIIVRLYRRRA